MKIYSSFQVLVISFFMIYTVGCANYTQQTEDMRKEFRAGRPKEALTHLEESDLKPTGKNRLLYYLESGMIEDRMGNYSSSRQRFIKAVQVSDELYTQSVTDTAASFVYNDSAQAYAGEDYERVAIHTMLAISFIGSKDWQGASVEARRINQKLRTINDEHGNSGNKYVEDAMARYLSGIIYERMGELDSACVDYQIAYDTYKGLYDTEFETSVPSELVKAILRVFPIRGRKDKANIIAKENPEISKEFESEKELNKKTGELVVVHEIGTIAAKVAEEFVIPFGKQVVRISFPVIPKGRLNTIDAGSGVDVLESSIKKSERAEAVQNLNYIARKTLEDRRGRMIAKTGARLLAKGQLTEQAYKQFGVVGGLAANIYSVVTETADTRSWTLLPARFSITRMRLPPGKHRIQIRTDGRVMSVKDIEIDNQRIEILRDRT